MADGRSVYKQEHDSKYGNTDSRCKLSSQEGVWRVTFLNTEYLRAATPSESPTSVKWQYRDYPWGDDLALTVTGLSVKPSSACEVTISLSQDIERDIRDPGVAGVYTATGSYLWGRPVLQHSGGLYTLSVYEYDGCWWVGSGLYSGSAPSQCPADPRAARNERLGETHWRYRSKQSGNFTESRGISVKCDKCIQNVTAAKTRIQGPEQTIMTLNVENEELRSLKVTLEDSIAKCQAEKADWKKKYEMESRLRVEESDVLKKKMADSCHTLELKLKTAENANAKLTGDVNVLLKDAEHSQTVIKEIIAKLQNLERSNANVTTKMKEMTNLFEEADLDSKARTNEIAKISNDLLKSMTLDNSPKIDLESSRD